MNRVHRAARLAAGAVRHPRATIEAVRDAQYSRYYLRGARFAEAMPPPTTVAATSPGPEPEPSPLERYVASVEGGRLLWKHDHYLEVYERHFRRFVGREVTVLEIGVYGGGSLEMWRAYFGEGCRVVGVDVNPSTKELESQDITILIGDQQDRGFWADVKRDLPNIDIVIDDGGHGTEQQIATLEELLPHIRPGGVFLCEDVCAAGNRFAVYAAGLVNELNQIQTEDGRSSFSEFDLGESKVTPFQAAVHSIHFYPWMVVVEKHERPPTGFPQFVRGTELPPGFASPGEAWR